MSNIKVSTVVEQDAWEDLKGLAEESHQTISGLLTEAIRDYVARRRIRPEVVQLTEDSMDENEELGKLLAQ